MNVHTTIDEQRWVREFTLEEEFRALDTQNANYHRYYQPEYVVSPKDLALTLQMRERAGMPVPPLTAVDVLLPAAGEPKRPEASKIGGTPYRGSRPWPRDRFGKPMQFFGQLCFADSKDILAMEVVASLPGDVLLIFREDSDELIWSEHDGAELFFEWEQAGSLSQRQAGELESVPPPSESFHFHRLRSVESDSRTNLEIAGRDIEVCGHWHSCKVGGNPIWVQSEDEADDLGVFIAAFVSLQSTETKQPLVNLTNAPEATEPYCKDLLMFGDMGTLYLFWDGSRVRWLMQCC